MSANPHESKQVRAVFFDAAGTLIRLAESVGSGYARVAQRHGFSLDPDATDAAFLKAWKAMPPMAESGGGDKAWWCRLVDRVLDEVGQGSRQGRDAYFDDLFAEYARPQMWVAYKEAAEVLDGLKEGGMRLLVLSNFDARLRPVLDGLGLAGYFEQIIVSSEIGVGKPEAEIFHHAVDQAGVPAGQCLHVGDSPIEDWRGAREAGLQVFELDRPEVDLRGLLDRLKLVGNSNLGQ